MEVLVTERIILIGALVVIVWLGIDQLRRHRRFMRLMDEINTAADAMATGDEAVRPYILMLMAECDRLNQADRIVTRIWSVAIGLFAAYVVLISI